MTHLYRHVYSAVLGKSRSLQVDLAMTFTVSQGSHNDDVVYKELLKMGILERFRLT